MFNLKLTSHHSAVIYIEINKFHSFFYFPKDENIIFLKIFKNTHEHMKAEYNSHSIYGQSRS